jgi:phospholipid/cholesterol/gamma-HCH transport system permease protein
MGTLTVRSLRLAMRPPFRWRRDAIMHAGLWIRRSLLPLAIAHGIYLIAFGIILFGHVFANIGVVERESGAMYLIWVREISTWITAMICAGVVGATITADLGARRIREELDALSVLGVDAIRSLVVPRVIASTFVLPVLGTLSLLWMLAINALVAPSALHFPPGVFFADLSRTIYPNDLVFPLLVKNLLCGLLIGVVACHKGLNCKLGTEGVGRAVSESVVASFFGVWLLNTFFNLAYLAVFTNAAVLHG